MTTFLILAATIALLILITATIRAVRTDGRGHLPAIRSHPGWQESGEDQAGTYPAGRSVFSTLPYLP